MLTDLQIAQAAVMQPITQIARQAGVREDSLSCYGRYIAKVDPTAYQDQPPRARLILVTAITPTPAGEGKTTVSVSLADGMRRNGKNAMLALREPSQGPVFGIKGGAAGGGYAQVLPMENINLHFTGDLHAITAANNLLAAMVDNHIQQGNALGIDPRQVVFRRCMDVNDRQLRGIVSGLGGKMNGMPREDGFDITAASEIMAAFCMASDLMDMKARMARITVGRTYAGKLVTCGDIGAQGAMAALLRDAMAPNLVQTIEGTPCLMHGGPFANIAHGCNSVIATRLAMKLSDYTVTEAGFGADLGAEKFIDIKCRAAGIYPDCVVLVATIRALKHHGGVEKDCLNQENVPAMLDGCANLKRHLDNIRTVWGAPAVVAINRFTSDTQAEIDALKDWLAQQNAPCALCEGWGKGGAGAQELAELVVREADGVHSRVPFFTYPDDMDLAHKIDAVARRVYGARGATFTAQAMKQLKTMEDEGFGRCPVCIAKTQYSFSDDAKRRNAPTDFDINIRSARLSAGAGFVVAFAGDIIAMPGLPRHPAALDIDVDENGRIEGLF
ncbi:MAG: formate--tetrahydrofolate ligase [Clostridiales bacterium]|nr:formate--tetrahydrofolate ligase [Clostridiales bacterium]MDD7121219.1 formate--tetrahydrofolate ligase [Clostridiales bacterium]MDY5469317.1 formate--tetrahydrofolate ligase [Eubacteriales bacterium]